MREKASQLKAKIDKSKFIVFFGGAGVSTESGIPDFRSQDGLYSQTFSFPPETMLSRTFFDERPDEFFRFYKSKVLHLEAKPNKAHLALAELEKRGKLKAVVTQNIDGLHQRAGSKKVLELHGSIERNYCRNCKLSYGAEYVLKSRDVPHCACGGVIKPDVVLYEEALNEEILDEATRFISNADMLIIGGTSLVVYPAAGLLNYFSGRDLVLINKSATSADRLASLVINDSIGDALDEVL
ncbi:MAG: NAD-dependent protein deacylase [Clostridiales bacterium]|jgi:NAD-dependent deacetylase|nr:NAD-dependent protein deacylase [Clostridiales bacterium]